MPSDHRRLWLVLLGVVALSGCTPTSIRIVEDFRAEIASRNFEAASEYLADNPRIWWEERKGSGAAWSLEGGRWTEWDDHFRGSGRPLNWRSEPGQVAIVMEEHNDYYRLTERGPRQYLRTYFLDEFGKIEGTMISAVADQPRDPGRSEEFDRWLLERYPEDYADLRPDGQIDPTGDRAARTRTRLEEWRRENGLPPLE